MNITVIGADGQLGTDICSALEKAGFRLNRLTIKDIDISGRRSVESVFHENFLTDLVINTAAFHHVEKCETDPVRSFKVNGLGAANLARACTELHIPLMHISTDYVFDGSKGKPYIESDIPNPLNVYAGSKLSGEYLIRSILNEFYILRLSGIYGQNICMDKGYNFVDRILQIGEERGEVRVVDDEVLAPTFTEDIAAQIVHMLKSNAAFGLYHVTAGGECSWYEFTKEIFRIKDTGVTVKKAAPGEFSGGVHRPAYSVLENKHLKDQGIYTMPHWKDGLKRYIRKYR